MTDPETKNSENEEESGKKFHQTIREKEERKLKSRNRKESSIWFGMGMFGLVGWSVSVPTLIGLGAGYWLDRTLNDPYAWTLMGLITGIVIGCFNAWFWISKEREQIHRDSTDEHE